MNDIYELLNKSGSKMKDLDKEEIYALTDTEEEEILNNLYKKEGIINNLYTQNNSDSSNQISKSSVKGKMKRSIVIALAAILLLGIGAFASTRWNSSLEKILYLDKMQESTENNVEGGKASSNSMDTESAKREKATSDTMDTENVKKENNISDSKDTENVKKELEDSGMVNFVEQSCTKQGITITADQCLVGEYYAFIAFRVNGYDLEEGDEPCVERSYIDIEGAGRADFDGYFDADYDKNGIPRWQKEDGSLHLMYIISVDPDLHQLPGKRISIQIKGLGIAPGKAEYIPVVDDIWEFEWELKGTDISKSYEVNVELGDTKATVTQVELSRFGVRTNMNFHPEVIGHTPTVDDDGKIVSYTDDYGYPPAFGGLRLKDGTILHPLLVTAKWGWLYEGEEMSDHYSEYFIGHEMIDIDQVDAVLYVGYGKENEENVYTVPLY